MSSVVKYMIICHRVNRKLFNNAVLTLNDPGEVSKDCHSLMLGAWVVFACVIFFPCIIIYHFKW